MYPIIFQLGPITIYSFGVFMALAALSAAWVVHAELKRLGYNPELASTMVFAAAIGGLIGSNSHARAGEGALIGAGVGALGGALVGNAMDQNDRKEAQRREKEERAYYERNGNYQADAYSGGAVTKTDVVRWTSRGTRDDVIIDRIERSGTVFHMSRGDEQDLRNAGVSEIVIQDMKATGRR